ncbi:flavin reductase family protein [Actinomadura syzygii]|uniref:Flavin reductase family protein n=1 Tax=Actinomadura syzygii TaxID=1427538 RepID=A0A5D0UDW0_9ACTN|nr:flavin reductase family protein [Actinomadura syzygii]TYC15966.1 flavin reductase family protein [Actinomadura syzygii]
MAAEPDAFREAMARFPAGVTIVTTHDQDGTSYGFTASSVTSVSMSPPLILVCLARTANCFPMFARTEHFAVSILRPHHAELAMHFAGKHPDKFARGGFTRTGAGSTVVETALATIECSAYGRFDAGDHVVLVGQVEHLHVPDGPTEPAVYVGREFATLCTGRGACLNR